jgi:ketosteroid isomerase-like protein
VERQAKGLAAALGAAAALVLGSNAAAAEPAASGSSSMTADTTKAAAEAVLAADARRRAANVAKDVATLEQLLTPDFTYTHNTGFREGREPYLARIRNAQVDYVAMDRLDAKVRVYGDVAVVDGLASMTYRNPPGGPEHTVRTLYTAVWVLQAGQWRIAAYASTLEQPQSQ